MTNNYSIPLKSKDPKDPPRPERTEDQWRRRRLKHVRRKLFTPRLEKDLILIPKPDFPTVDLWGGEGLFIHGQAGAGKTVYASQIILDVDQKLWCNYQHKDLLFSSVPVLFSKLKHAFDSDKLNGQQILEEQQKTWLLVLDDLGVSGKPSDWLLETLYLVINYRYENLLPTIITSNFGLATISKVYEDVRIISRIERMCKIVKKRRWDSPST